MTDPSDKDLTRQVVRYPSQDQPPVKATTTQTRFPDVTPSIPWIYLPEHQSKSPVPVHTGSSPRAAGVHRLPRPLLPKAPKRRSFLLFDSGSPHPHSLGISCSIYGASTLPEAPFVASQRNKRDRETRPAREGGSHDGLRAYQRGGGTTGLLARSWTFLCWVIDIAVCRELRFWVTGWRSGVMGDEGFWGSRVVADGGGRGWWCRC